LASLKKFNIDKETIDILSKCNIEGKVLYLPDIQLERHTYEKINKVLTALGAKWNKKSKGHVFDYDITESLKLVVQTGEVTDWKKSTDFFYTPEAVVSEMLGLVPMYTIEEFTFLEPSAGQGHILDLVKENFPNVITYCVEQNPLHCERLKEKGYNPIQEDFLNIKPFDVDAILMNPPFTYEMEHIQHAHNFIKENGILISITSAGILTKPTKKGKEFLEWYKENCGYDYMLPANSFKESGTNVNTKMLVFQK